MKDLDINKTEPSAPHKSWKILPGHMFKLCIRLHTKTCNEKLYEYR